MEQDKIIKLTLAAQIAGQIAGRLVSSDKDKETIATEVADLTLQIVNKLNDSL